MEKTSMKETKIAILADNLKIILNDEGNIHLSLNINGSTQHIFPIPYPSDGYGGGSLLLSPTGQYLLFSYYSGQNEEAFMLFCIENYRLTLIYESGYSYGEMSDYCFSDDEHFLFQSYRIDRWYADCAEIDENGNAFYKFGSINILNIQEKTFDKHILHVYPSDNWKEDITDNGPFEFDSIINNSLLNMTMPWGKETFHYPLKDIITIDKNSSDKL